MYNLSRESLLALPEYQNLGFQSNPYSLINEYNKTHNFHLLSQILKSLLTMASNEKTYDEVLKRMGLLLTEGVYGVALYHTLWQGLGNGFTKYVFQEFGIIYMSKLSNLFEKYCTDNRWELY